MKKNEDKNSLHTEYGILSNSVYVLKKINKYCPFLIWMMALGVFTNSLMQYLWIFIGKFVIDIAETQANSPDKDISPLLRLVLITTAIELIAKLLNTVTDNKRWYYFLYVRENMLTENIAKAMTMNYQSLEKPDILDMYQKARQATGGSAIGVEGMMRIVYDLSVQFVIMLVTFAAVSALDLRLIAVLTAAAFMQYLFFRHTVKKDKKEVWDVLPPTWRKINYMERITQDLDFAKDIRLFGMKNLLSDKQHEVLRTNEERIIYSRDLWIKNSVFSHSMSVISSGAMYAILIYIFIGGDMTIGNFTLYLGLSGTFSASLNAFLNMLGRLKENSMQTDDFRSFMDLAAEDESDKLPVPKTDRYVFEFKNVSFKYDGAEGYALKNLNLTLEAGKKLAVVGLNGAGKTTFIKLLLRLYDVTEGEILLNGTNINNFRRDEYYALFSPVFQNVEVFAFPMSENISMKRPEETDSAFALKCAEKAGLDDKINSLEKGIGTEMLKIIHDDGVDLSGGEKQKLALARALYKNAPMIVLDEPTAALDALAEYELYRNFNELIGGRAAVYISHRLSSTRFCDGIAMFRDGGLAEYGTHEELMAKGGAYAEMFEVQAQYYKDGEQEYAG